MAQEQNRSGWLTARRWPVSSGDCTGRQADRQTGCAGVGVGGLSMIASASAGVKETALDPPPGRPLPCPRHDRLLALPVPATRCAVTPAVHSSSCFSVSIPTRRT